VENRVKGLRKVKLGDIDPFKFGNPKARTERDGAILDRSMQEFGYVMPMLVRGVGGRFELLDGHHRYEQIVDGRPEELYRGDKVDVVVVDVRDDNEARRIFLALQHKAAYDYTQLDSFIEQMLKDGVDTADGIMAYSGLSPDLVDSLASAGAEFLDDMVNEAADGDEVDPETTNENASRAGLVAEHVTFATPLTREQNETVHSAIRVAKELHGVEVTGDAITLICNQYLERNRK
jgi:hypothetical protein